MIIVYNKSKQVSPINYQIYNDNLELIFKKDFQTNIWIKNKIDPSWILGEDYEIIKDDELPIYIQKDLIGKI
jgi:hypothetical protein